MLPNGPDTIFTTQSPHCSLTALSVFAPTLGACNLINTSPRKDKSSSDQQIIILHLRSNYNCNLISLMRFLLLWNPANIRCPSHMISEMTTSSLLPMDQNSSICLACYCAAKRDVELPPYTARGCLPHHSTKMFGELASHKHFSTLVRWLWQFRNYVCR